MKCYNVCIRYQNANERSTWVTKLKLKQNIHLTTVYVVNIYK